ncbi:serine/threonine-protein kinase [Yinghuangia seranimata]|uniref:serine/threonine-protein kinase n=1 Tax=Yinghuangia seranimata TaxID=408067 RepID=UPI00248D0A33|nr:serine/threonine-protein kinase [Yinghuangia seranimata]MDI2126727.1 serine/threonine-protein kinase [Yinghuangia seranimata]
MDPLLPTDPSVIGRYRLAGRLGVGGMGVVYAASASDGSGEPVAIKLVRPEFAADGEFRARFGREIDAMRRVRGRCVATVLDWDTAAPQPWFAAELVAGPTLAQYVAGHGPLPPGPLAALAAGVAEALVDIHAAGVVHRDLKPSNVVLAAGGPKVLDFGIARTEDATALTRTGLTVGSPGWLSPEQLRGEDAFASTDVFSWGLLVGYAATGRSPFGTGAPEGVGYRVLAEPPDLGGLPSGIRELVDAALIKDAPSRPTAADLLAGMTAMAGAFAAGAVDATTYVTGLLARDWDPALARTTGRFDQAWPIAQPPNRRKTVLRRSAVVAGAAAAVAGVLIAVNLSGGSGSSGGSGEGVGAGRSTTSSGGALGGAPSVPGVSGGTTPPQNGGSSPSSRTPSTPPSSPSVNLTRVDWRNRGYPDVCAFDPRPTTPIQVRGGTAPPSDGVGANTEVQDPVYGEMSGRSVAVLPVLCTGLNHTPEYLVAYAAGPDGPVLLDFDLMDGGQRYIQATRISDDRLTVTYVGHSPSQPLASPDKTVTATYRLNGDALTPVGGDVRQTVSPRS